MGSDVFESLSEINWNINHDRPHIGIGKIAWHLALCAPEIELEGERVSPWPAVEHPSDVLTYRVPLKTVSAPRDEEPGHGH